LDGSVRVGRIELVCQRGAVLISILVNLIGRTMSVATSKLVTRPVVGWLKDHGVAANRLVPVV
jgi:hypothetical protein